MPAKLKVFRTPIGFHDAYVAAPSQKAALAAWGSDANLFARGQAEQVTDPKLMKAPLESPGTVIKIVRGTAAEHMAALPPSKPKSEKPARRSDQTEKAPKPVTEATPKAKPKPNPKPKPRPSREALDQAEAALKDAEERFAGRQREIAAREAALAREKKDLRVAQERDVQRLERERADAEKRFQHALAKWRSET